MATEFTKKGHRLEAIPAADKSPIFQCRTRALYFDGKHCTATEDHVLAQMLVLAPCTVGQIVETIRAWLAVYGDEELLGQVEGVVHVAIGALPPFSPSTPSMVPQRGHNMQN